MKYLLIPFYTKSYGNSTHVSTKAVVDHVEMMFPNHRVIISALVTTLTEIDDGQAEQD